MNWETAFTKNFNLTYPIVQGGLARLAYSDLAAAVSNAGGLGQITAMCLESREDLREEIKRTRELTNKPFSVNFAIGRRPADDRVQVAIEEDVEIISLTGGNPAPILKMIENTGIKSIVLVSTVRQAQKAEELGADALVVVGHEGGGHLGRSDTGVLVITPQIAEAVTIPVLASGGIVDGKGLMAALALGADGIAMGTRFIATKDCTLAHDVYKQRILDAGDGSTVVIKRTLGTPARAFKNDWTEQILAIERENGGFEQLKEYITSPANKRFIYEGKDQEGYAWASQGVARIHNIPTVEELIHTMIQDAEQIRKSWA